MKLSRLFLILAIFCAQNAHAGQRSQVCDERCEQRGVEYARESAIAYYRQRFGEPTNAEIFLAKAHNFFDSVYDWFQTKHSHVYAWLTTKNSHEQENPIKKASLSEVDPYSAYPMIMSDNEWTPEEHEDLFKKASKLELLAYLMITSDKKWTPKEREVLFKKASEDEDYARKMRENNVRADSSQGHQ